MNINYWNVAKYGIIALLAILVIAIVTKIRMFLILWDLLGLLVAVLIVTLAAIDGVTFLNKKLNEKEAAKKAADLNDKSL